MLSLCDDMLYYIFSFLHTNSQYYLVNKELYRLRKNFLLSNSNFKDFSKNRKYWLTILTLDNHYNLSKDIGKYRERILFFIADKDKKIFIYPCQNSYHRMLVHKFCDSQGLSHETITNGYKTRLACAYCDSSNIRLDKYSIENECLCLNCNKLSSSLDYVWRKFKTISMELKAIKISKK